MEIAKQKIEKGEHKLIQIPVAELINGELVLIEVEVFRSKQDGPVVLLTSGMHGDEITGVKIISEALKQNLFNNLKQGTVIVIPLVNEIGFNRGERELFGKDINRCFPGSSSGSMASIIADIITKEILPHVTFGIDFHSGSVGIYNVPQIRISKDSRETIKIGKQTGTTILVKKDVIEGSLRQQALEMGKTILIFEGGEALRLDPESVREGVQYIRNLLISNEMIKGDKPTHKITTLTQSSWERSPSAGIFRPIKQAGDEIGKRDIFGYLDPVFSGEESHLLTRKIGIIIGMRTTALVNKGDALCHIALF